jgi:uncharacterized membrane protein (UPF0182 family)
MQPYYTIMRLAERDDAEFIQMLPFTPRSRDNLAAWLVARSDGEHYGRLSVFQFPKQKLVFGPRQVVARINQDQAISPQITLWNQQGSEVIWGTLIGDTARGVADLRAAAVSARFRRSHPELRRCLVAYQNQIVMERRSMPRWQLFGALPPTSPTRRCRVPNSPLAARLARPPRRAATRLQTALGREARSTTTAPSPPSAPATGPSTARSPLLGQTHREG